METEALAGNDRVYPEPEVRIKVAVLLHIPALKALNVTVAELPPG